MKNYKRISIISNLILTAVLVVVYVSSFFTTRTIPIYGGSPANPIYNGNTDRKAVSIMINVYENTEVVCDMMDILKVYDAKATFFVGGCWADDNEKTLNRMVEEGHEIGNHGYFHKDHAKLDYQKNKEEILFTEKVVQSLCGKKTTLFAPPSGSFSSVTLEVAESLDYKVIMWSKDTIDWRDKDLNKTIERATKNAKSGDFILMHPKPHTLLALKDVLEYYKKEGFALVTVSENLSV